MKIRFYKEEDDRWYADLPTYINDGVGTKEDLEMVSGADTWLSMLSEGGDEITLQISEEPFEDAEAKLLYIGDTALNIEGEYLVYPDMHYMWLCKVTMWVFNEYAYPQAIYYKIIPNNI